MTPTRLAKFILAAGLALTLASGFAACGKKPSGGEDADARAVRVTSVEMRSLQGGLTASGALVSREEAAVYPELSGFRVTDVFVEQGAVVKAGQPLAQLDDTLLKQQIAQQAALVAQQKVAVEQAQTQAKAVADLEGQGVLSGEQLDQRRFQARSKQAAFEAQTASLRDLETRQARMTIRAPTAGVVLERNVRPGDVAAGGGGANPMFRIARDGLIELEAQTPEGDIDTVHVGDAVKVDLADGQSVMGTVRLISPSIDAATKLGKVRIRLPVRDDIRAGGYAQAEFTGSARSRPSVPETAIRYDADGASVMVVGADNRVSQAPVKTGLHVGGFVELLQGPPVGARVLERAAAFVLQGDVVKPVGATLAAGTRAP